MKRESVIKGTIMLAMSGLFNKGLGFLLKIFLARTIGAGGLGLFQMIYPLFTTLILLCTAGLPLTLSKIIPEKNISGKTKDISSLLKVSLLFTLISGSFSAILLYQTAQYIASSIYNNPHLYYTIMGLIPVLIICPISSVFKGFFQGCKTMKPTALARTSEQINRFTATIIIIHLLRNLELKYQTIGIGLGIAIGELTALLLLLYLFTREYNSFIQPKSYTSSPQSSSWVKLFKQIMKISLPVTSGRFVNSLMMSIKAFLIPGQLKQSGLTPSRAASLYGQLGGMVQQIILLPLVITGSLTTSFIPSISEAYANNKTNKIKRNYRDIIRIATYLGFPLTAIFYLYGTEICSLLFSYPEAGKMLSGLAFSATFIYYLQLSSGFLNALGHPGLALLNITAGSIIQLSGIYFLVRIPELRIQGAIIAITAGFIISALLNYLTLGKIIGFPVRFYLLYLKPLFCSSIFYILYSGFNHFFLQIYSKNFAFFILIIFLTLNILLYLALMYLCGAITRKEIGRFF